MILPSEAVILRSAGSLSTKEDSMAISATQSHLPAISEHDRQQAGHFLQSTLVELIALSLIGILTFTFILPAFGAPSIGPEWSWGFFTAAGGLFGSWCASKTQLYFPEHILTWMLGSITGVVGALYILHFVTRLPFAF